MRIAISSWRERVSPLFDVAALALIIDAAADSRLQARHDLRLPEDPLAKIDCLVGARVDELICGAISRPLQERLAGCGIGLTAFISGDIEDVLSAFRSGTIGDSAFAMPGCRGGCRRRFRAGSPGSGSGCPRRDNLVELRSLAVLPETVCADVVERMKERI